MFAKIFPRDGGRIVDRFPEHVGSRVFGRSVAVPARSEGVGVDTEELGLHVEEPGALRLGFRRIEALVDDLPSRSGISKPAGTHHVK